MLLTENNVRYEPTTQHGLMQSENSYAIALRGINDFEEKNSRLAFQKTLE